MGALHPPRRSLLSANQDITPAALPPLRRQNPREEPGALAALAGISAGASSNPRPYRDHLLDANENPVRLAPFGTTVRPAKMSF